MWNVARRVIAKGTKALTEEKSASALIPVDMPYQSNLLRPWLWSIIPLLAVAAYLTALRIGFLSDDLVLLNVAASKGMDLHTLLPNADWPFYRPVGAILTWQLGWQLWGFNPFPYHLLGLAFHAVSALMLALWLATATSRRGLGWLAGALFAVYPLNTEAVGWLAAQWDAMAVAFGLTSLWLFAHWWRGRATWLYFLSFLLYTLGIFSKESLFTFLPMFVLSAWLGKAPASAHEWRRHAYVMIPFIGVLAVNISIRLAYWGNLGSYSNLPTNYLDFAGAALGKYAGLLIAPINTALLPVWLQQSALVGIGLGLLVGVALCAKRWWRLLILAFVWVLLSLLPVLNLYRQSVNSDDLQGNRYLYLASAGYCVGVATLLYGTLNAARRWRPVVLGAISTLLLGYSVACWLYLLPWHTATVQANSIESELRRLVPPQARPNGMIWFLQNAPDTYKGAFVLRLGLGNLRYFTTGGLDVPWTEKVDQISEAGLNGDARDAFAFSFRFDKPTLLFHVDDATGVSHDISPPQATSSATLRLWDFQNCPPKATEQWNAVGATIRCEKGKGLLLQPEAADPQIVGPELTLDLKGMGAQFLRFRVAARYPSGESTEPMVSELFWQEGIADFDATRLKRMPISTDGSTHVYWFFLAKDKMGAPITRLRFDPINSRSPVEIEWIAVDLVK